MKIGRAVSLMVTFAAAAQLAPAGEGTPARRVKFSGGPTAKKAGEGTAIAFALSGKADV